MSGGGWGLGKAYFGRLDMGGDFLLVRGGEWRWVEVYFGWMGVVGDFLWVSGRWVR